MLTAEMNQRMTGTGPGTPGGSFLRSYWFPIAAVADLDTEPVQPIRLLGEDLTLFRTLKGELGLIAQRCAHRALPLMYGIPDETGLRCAYHGWIYNTEGRVVDMPFEPACLPLQVASYPVEALGGLVFTYMGPEPRPLLPRWEAFVREGRDTRINFTPLPCNYVQCMDNSMDPVHFEYLHGHYGNYLLKLRGQEPAFNTATAHVKIDFDVEDNGLIYKRRLLTGDSEDSEDWTTGHPIVFPYMLASPTGGLGFQIRVPVDDTHTMHILYSSVEPADPAHPTETVTHTELEFDSWGRVNRSGGIVVPQDMMAWVEQGPVMDRSLEHLATSDKGVILYHNLLAENIDKVERGEDPYGVIRDGHKNEMLQIKKTHAEREGFNIPGRERERSRF